MDHFVSECFSSTLNKLNVVQNATSIAFTRTKKKPNDIIPN